MTQTYAKRGKARNQRALALVPFLLASAAACGSDTPASGYFLRGRVFDGASLDPVGKAELTLISGEGIAHATSNEDGTYSLGPIEPSSSYRVGAKADGMADFEFTGVALPALDPMSSDRTRTLIGDVALYQESMKSPAFKVMVESSDVRLPANIASVDFMPANVGTDPSRVAAVMTPPAGAVVGAFAEPRGATMPNDKHAETVAFHTTVMNGNANIPEDALTWGSTYNVRVDAGPDFTPVTFMLTPVKATDVAVVVPTTARFPTQLPQQTQQYFTGRIYNGVSLDRLKNFKVTLAYFDRTMEATVDADGRYVVGPLLANADYTISVEADGFRDFLSHNVKIATSVTNQVSSLYFDAFLYPEGVKAPAVQAKFSLQGETKLPSGTVRFAPTGSSSLFNDDAETPAGVNRQVWLNDEDLQQRAVTKDFTDGKLEMTEGEFVLGVQYAVTVYGVANYALLTGGSFRAGIDANPTFTLQPITESPLEVVAMSTDGAALSPNGSIEIRFNHDIVAYPKMDQMVALRSLNDGFAIASPDKNMDGKVNTLVNAADLTAPIAPSYRGVAWEISGDRMTLKWTREQGLKVSDTADPITSVTYANLSAITLYTGTLPTSPASTLDVLLGVPSLTAQMVAQ
ncbi:MAG TPA: carboxypeptidase-like regulatory domain-containing protein [Polyangiales bacterium]|nr:carboxypeptidase-like regulatory domain-containing protein [Polyangiales bacterium]